MNKIDVAVLLIVFNRLSTTKQVFETIKKAKISRLYIASDGPRFGTDDQPKIEAVREFILKEIDWECQVFTLFREENLSCGLSVKNAIDWFFQSEEYGIILEDDVLPSSSFFKYCDFLLRRYRYDDRIGMISGNNFVTNECNLPNSYTFSKFFNTWGWATWKRAWQNMDLSMSWKNTSLNESVFQNMGYTRYSYRAWKMNYEVIENKTVNAWDYQWSYSLSCQNQLSIVPEKNLVSNIGFTSEATHTVGRAKEAYTKLYDINFPLNNPTYILCNREYESQYEKFQYSQYSFYWVLKHKIRQILKNLYT